MQLFLSPVAGVCRDTNLGLLIRKAKQLPKHLLQRPLLRRGQGIEEADMMLLYLDLLAEAEDIAQADAVDDLRRRAAVDLAREDMIQPHTLVRIERLEARTLVEAPYDLGHIHARFHIEVGERRLRIVEAARVLPLEPIHHIPYHALRRENLIRLLRRDVVEDIPFRIRREIVRELPALPHKLLDCIIEHHRIEEMAVEMPFMCLIADLPPAFILLVVVAAVAQHAERIERDALTTLRVHRDLPEHLRGDERIEILQRRIFVAVRHEECGNRPGETAQMIADIPLDTVLLALELLCLDRLDNLLRCLLHRLLAAEPLLDIRHHPLIALLALLSIRRIDIGDHLHRGACLLCRRDLFIALMHELVIADDVIRILAADHLVCRVLDLPLEPVLGIAAEMVSGITLACSCHP